MIEVNNQQDLARELQANRKVLALFYASWCPYCMNFLRAFNREIAEYKFDSVIRVNLDDYDNPLWDDYSVDAVPTVVFFEETKIRSRLDGRFGAGLSERQFKDWLENLSNT
jgi:thioredoxin 1